ncbi:flagellar biosynthetic protein FliR [Oleisolibacter albus]|uniref:flagellar biosynthetic protein FliR n=1 Tax=Oleisolibacter albus TaxID=2171757 RepID=UPI000DF3C80E|nr:flagellar biosynthetic protein FliR [Oleisolibacter albus]
MLPSMPLSLPLTQLLTAEIYGFLLVLVRVGAALSMLPGFGEMAVPLRARMAAAIAVSLALSAIVPGLPAVPPDAPSDLLRQLFGELMAGAVLGVGARIIFGALQMAGQLISQTVGLSSIFAQPGLGFEAGSVLGSYLMLGGLVLIFVTDLHLAMITALVESYRLMPPAVLPSMGMLAKLTVETVSTAFRMAVQFSGPFLVLGFVYNVGIGLVNRAMPQFAVYFIGLPVSILGGLVVVALTIGVVATTFLAGFGDWLHRFGG